MDESGRSKNEVIRLLREAESKDLTYNEDGKSRILGSMCTSSNVFGKDVFSRFMETNLGDAGLFKGTRDLERKVIASIASLQGLSWREGHIVTGGSEANIIALWAARNMTKKKSVVVPETAHFSFDKACDILGLNLIKAQVDEDKRVDTADLESKIDSDTCAIVGVAGTTEYGTVDDIPALSQIAGDKGVYLHVDAAFGGFVLPFLKDLGYPVSFDLPEEGVDSITLDPHKMGFVPIPSGCIIFRERKTMEFIGTSSPYLSQKKQYTVVGTRTGASAAASFAVFKLLGREGYRAVVKSCMENTLYLYKNIFELGLFARSPTMNILVFTGDESIYSGLLKKGWRLSKTIEGEIRIVLMPHVTRAIIDEFLGDLKVVMGE